MNCKTAQARIGAYLDGELGGRDAIELRSHVDQCRHCQREEADVRGLKRAIAAIPIREPSAEFEQRLLGAVARESARETRHRRVAIPLFAGVAVSSMLLTYAIMSAAHNNRVVSEAKADRAHVIDFEIQRDQAYFTNSNPLGGQSVVVQTAYGRR